MSSTRNTHEIDEMMEQASAALARTDYFAAERLADCAMRMAHAAQDYERMARIALPLQEARRQRYQMALDLGRVEIVKLPITDEMPIDPGCWLVQPPHVGAEARRMRLMALDRQIPAAVLCREPRTSAGLVPIVAVGGGMTVRCRILPPANPDKPDLAWFAEAMEQLGDAAVESIDPTMEITRRVSAVLDRLDAMPDHEDLHQVLEAYCREAAAERAAKKKKKSVARSQT